MRIISWTLADNQGFAPRSRLHIASDRDEDAPACASRTPFSIEDHISIEHRSVVDFYLDPLACERCKRLAIKIEMKSRV